MLFKSLVLGILFGIGVFALKSGLGLTAALLSRPRGRQELFGLLLFALVWALVFAAVALVLPRLDPLRHLAAIALFMRSGMLIHLLLAGLMLIWGVILLRRREVRVVGSRGWLLLVLPCPVCVTVIFLSAAFFLACFPEHGAFLVPGLYLVFMTISLTAAFLAGRNPVVSASPESFLGGAMILLATYFFLSVTIMPQFADLDKIYRLAVCPEARTPAVTNHWFPVPAAIGAAFGAGFGLTWNRARRLK